MGDKSKEKGKAEVPKPKKGGFLRNIFYLALLALVALGILAYLSFDPQDLSDIDGYRAEEEIVPPAPPDIPGMLEDVMAKERTVTITEQQLNLYLRGTVRFSQEGFLKQWIQARGVWVRLESGQAEVILEREINGKRHTISMYLRPEQELDGDGVLHTKVHRSQGRWGRTKVLRGFLLLTSPSFKSLSASYSKELKALERLFESKVTITITDDHIELQPPR